MILQFKDLLNLNIPNRIIDSFSVKVETVDILIQESLIELQNDLTAKKTFSSEKYNFWFKNNMTEKYNILYENAELFLIAFSSLYLVKTKFCRGKDLITEETDLML
ncbi:hypothetical protein DMUE_1266 [Dictyocoela muelleri]|nr:hypothetical protein DMUE_1266 [Dictyocoela muelleri]